MMFSKLIAYTLLTVAYVKAQTLYLAGDSTMAADDGTDTPTIKTKRTRKRFSPEQLIILETAYRVTSHPSRDEREVIAKKTEL